MSKLTIGLSLSCIDYRLFEATIRLLLQDCQVDAFDHTILAGGSLGFNQDEYKTWPPTWLDHVNLAIELHNIQKIVVIDHMDCGAYRLFYPCLKDHPERERELHIYNVKKFLRHVKRLYPHIPNAGYLISLDGSYERIFP